LSVNRARTARRIVLDRWASRVVVVGGIFIIACILAILFVIALEVYPLFKPASATLAGTYGAAVAEESGRPAPGSALGVDEYREIAFVVTRGGALDFISLTGGANPPAVPIAGLDGARVASVAALGKGRYAIGTSDGRVIPLDMAFDVAFPDGKRRIRPQPVFGRRRRSIPRPGARYRASSRRRRNRGR
jgi:phosphate transport system permease protein